MHRTIICIVALILLDIGVLCWSCSGRLVPQTRMRQEALNIVRVENIGEPNLLSEEW